MVHLKMRFHYYYYLKFKNPLELLIYSFSELIIDLTSKFFCQHFLSTILLFVLQIIS